VGIATRLPIGRPGFLSPVEVKDFSPKRPDLFCGFLFSGYRCSFLRFKRPGREVNYSPPSSAEVTNEWSCTSTPPICLHDVDWENL
jgi:hypothetical protein